jgi:branched-subunit amino acid aminotransferase/4-amino-4-deoxychorismate lyase
MDATDPSVTSRPATTPRPIAWVEGRVLPASDATVPLLDEGFLRGDAVFEAVLVRGGRTFALEPHLSRLHRSGAALDLTIPDVRQVVVDLLVAWGERDGALRLIVTRGGTVRGLLSAAAWPDTISLAVVEAAWRTALSGVKTLSYAANQWAIRVARTAEADDALIVDAGYVHELPTGSLCLVQDGRISTPDPARLPILDSVTVRSLEAVAEVDRAVPTLEDVAAADELFVVSATRPVLPVDTLVLSDRQIEFEAPGTVTARVQEAFEKHIGDHLDPLP